MEGAHFLLGQTDPGAGGVAYQKNPKPNEQQAGENLSGLSLFSFESNPTSVLYSPFIPLNPPPAT